MRTLYLDCGMGAAGDMLTAALLELLPEQNGFLSELNALGIPGVEFRRETAVRSGITGTRIIVTVGGKEEESVEGSASVGHGQEHHHHHSSMHGIGHLVAELPLSEKVKNDILAVYGLIAEAESHVHGVPVEEVHFHEVGALDAVADVAAVCLLMEKLSPQQVVVSPVRVGSGQVRCAHGILPVPAPATAYLLREIPIYGGDVKGELCTPTGAALLKYFAARFGPMPAMCVSSIGYGMGSKDFETADCVRALLGETEEYGGVVVELSCNLDDMTAEEIGFAEERFFAAGALDVYTIPIGMKKSRPGVMLCVMCDETKKDEMVRLLFQYTTTLGIRESVSRRYMLERSVSRADTPAGPVRQKLSQGYGVTRVKYEYEDLTRIAREKDLSLSEVKKLLGLV